MCYELFVIVFTNATFITIVKAYEVRVKRART